MIEAKNLSLVFSGTGAGIQNISTRFREGEWVTLLGASGSGKTTLLRLIAGLENPSHGDLVKNFKPEETSFVFQEPALLPWKSVLENIILPLSLRGVSFAEAEKRAEPWLQKLKIKGFAQAKPHELSGGLKMRVSLARALVTNPKLLLLDEPFAALDEPIRIELGIELRNLFLQLKPTVVMVTHSITEGLWLGDRVVVLQGKPGNIVLDDPIDLGEQRPLSLRGKPEFLKKVEACFRVLSK